MKAIGLVLVLVAAPVFAQEPVNRAADVISWGTAAVNPIVATVQALRSEDKVCQLGRLAISEGIGNGVTLALKHFIDSPRPCLGCDHMGMPSGHSMNAVIGASWNLKVSWTFALGTAQLRRTAHKHTLPQVAAGLGLGALSEFAGQKLLHCHE